MRTSRHCVTLLAVLALATFAIPSPASASSSATVPTRHLAASGGTIKWPVMVHNAKTCIWSSSPKVAGFDGTVKCTTGRVIRPATFKANTSTKAKDYTLNLVVRGMTRTVDHLKVVEARMVAPSTPTVTSISPTQGPTGGGTVVTVTGTNFASGATVSFGGVAATGVTVASATSLTATAPAGTGTVNATVTTSGGTSATTAADQFTYLAPPTVTSISPTQGPTGGGTVVTVTGRNFASGATVSFGGVAATGVTVASATSLTATSPAGTGTVNTTVTTSGGTSATSTADQFTYLVISAIGSLVGTDYPSGGTTLTVDPQNIGDVLVVCVDSHVTFGLSSLSGGGVTTWNRAVQFISARDHDIELWFGTVTTAGSSEITFNWSSPGINGSWTEYTAQEFTADLGAGTTWSIDNGQAESLDGPSSTTVPYPTLTSSGSGDLYYGYAGMPNAP